MYISRIQIIKKIIKTINLLTQQPKKTGLQ